MASLEAVNQRIYSAGERLHLLEEQVRDFIESPDVCDYWGEKDGKVLILQIEPQGVPDAIIESAGEIGSELWAALCDLLSWLTDENVEQFPICHTAEEFAAWMDAHLPQVGEEERAIIESFQPYETADWLSWLRDIAREYAAGNLEGSVQIDGDIKRSRPMPEPDTGATEQRELVLHRIRNGTQWSKPNFNVHVHVALSVQVCADGTPTDIVLSLQMSHSSARELVDALQAGQHSG